MTTPVDDPTPGRRAAARAPSAIHRRESDGGRFRYHVCSLEPGGEYEETIVEVVGDQGSRYFATDDGARMTEVSERYVAVRRMSEIRSMHELDLDEMAELEDELGFERQVAGHDPLADPAWTEFLDEADPARPTGPVTPLAATAPQVPHTPHHASGPVAPIRAVPVFVPPVVTRREPAPEPPAPEQPAPEQPAPEQPAPEHPAADRREPDLLEPDLLEPDERITLEDLTETPEPARAARAETDPARSTRDEHMTMDSEADWTFEQFEAVVAGSAPAPAPARQAPTAPVAPVAPVTPITPAAAVQPAAPTPVASAPVASAPVAPTPVAPAPVVAPAEASARPAASGATAAALQIGLAQGIAFVAHRGQTDQLGAEYIDHPGRVAETFDPVTQSVEVAVAWLHDVLEDTDLSAQRLREAGVSPEVIAAVQLLTRTPDVPEADYYARIRTNAVARSVKLADIADNSAPWRLRKLDHETQARLTEKYEKARAALS
ncbi:hypothetical protein SAMN05428970_2775 [Agromyces sp. CF514]|uniref:hypothetical protein n=1 Tax=Agromyces sp. CF514 TaxID=1881031 RepID=UPI0008E03B94|nr:hypothetical protein [Agromyces sp. CF514]SFR83289.1 hypothetical protein SAMN05428970_2775 [Agromyces sp. CF514]